MKAKFKKFLIDNGAYRKFVRNVKDQKGMSFNEYCGIDGIWNSAITSAFSWDKAPDGFDYWHTLSNKWLKAIKK